jgi:hypothetical protein
MNMTIHKFDVIILLISYNGKKWLKNVIVGMLNNQVRSDYLSGKMKLGRFNRNFFKIKIDE